MNRREMFAALFASVLPWRPSGPSLRMWKLNPAGSWSDPRSSTTSELVSLANQLKDEYAKLVAKQNGNRTQN